MGGLSFLWYLFGMASLLGAQTSMQGMQSGVWGHSGSPFFVQDHILVPHGQTLTLEPGVAVQFNGFFSIEVEGQLIARGTSLNPILFTSSLDSLTGSGGGMAASKLDWSKIYFKPNSAGELIFCTIRYCFEGLKSQGADLKLTEIILDHINNPYLEINGQTILATAGKPMNYSTTVSSAPAASRTTVFREEDYLSEFKKKKNNWWVLPLTGTGLVLTGGLVYFIWINQEEDQIGGPPIGPN